MNTLKLLGELEAKAHELLQADSAPNEALVALEKLADKHLRPLVEALEGTARRLGAAAEHFGRTDPHYADAMRGWATEANTALAALHTDLKAALKEVGE